MAEEREYTVKADFPNMMKGEGAPGLEVPGVGLMKNGESKKVELSREQAEFLASAHGIEITTSGGKAVKGKPFEAVDEDAANAPETEEVTEVESGESVTEVTDAIKG